MTEAEDFEGCDMDSIQCLFVAGGQLEVLVENITDWMEVDAYDPVHGVRSDEAIVQTC